MKWFKHMTDSLDDPFIQTLMDKYSHLGYAVWFGLIEIIAKENGNKVTGKITISQTYLRRKLRTSRTKLREVLDFCQTSSRLLLVFSQENVEIDFPKIAEIKDNYTKDLQASCKKLSIEVEVEVEAEVEVEKDLKTKTIAASKKPTRRKATQNITDEDFINALKINPAYQGVDVDRELGKMDAWLLMPQNKARKKTHKFILGWLGRTERTVTTGGTLGKHTGLSEKDYREGTEDF